MLNQYKFKTEFHAHTNPASACGDFPPEEVVKKYADIGYSSIIISNHFYPGMRYFGEKEKCLKAYFEDYYEAATAGEKYNINVILGCEIRFSENFNDYLLFGIDRQLLFEAYEYIDKGLEAFSKWFRNDSRVIVQAHPFRSSCTPVNPSYLDGVESFNMHPGHNSRVALAAKYAKEHDFIVTAGTDFHHEGHEGMAAVLTKTEIKNSYDVAKVLKERDYIFEIGKSIVLPYGIK